jgi:Pgp3 C-terminal domain
MPTTVSTNLHADRCITAAKIADATITKEKMADRSVGTTQLEDGAATAAKVAAGAVVRVVNAMSGAVATTTTTTADVDAVPTTSHGAEFMTVTITPTSATSKLIIEVVANVASSFAGVNIMTLGLHQDATANAISAVQQGTPGQNVQAQLRLVHYMTSGTTSPTTFRVRIGGSSAGTTTFNGVSGARKMGGVMASSITITEIKA